MIDFRHKEGRFILLDWEETGYSTHKIPEEMKDSKYLIVKLNTHLGRWQLSMGISNDFMKDCKDWKDYCLQDAWNHFNMNQSG